jgi:hypothetical protein
MVGLSRLTSLVTAFLVVVLVPFERLSMPAAGGEPELQRVVPAGPPGVCGVAQWKASWPGCVYEDGVSEGRLSVVNMSHGLGYRVDYAVGEIGPDKGGVGWRYPIVRGDAVELAYTVSFSDGFDWVKGGKLPGLCGGPDSVSGGNPADGRNGFSTRLMWRADGRGEAYVYHMNQREKFGDSVPFPDDFRFPTKSNVMVRLRVTLNTPGRRDGRLDVWIRRSSDDAERKVVQRSDMEWRSDPTMSIDGVLFETFHGGGDRTWAPQRPSSSTFSAIVISTQSHSR